MWQFTAVVQVERSLGVASSLTMCRGLCVILALSFPLTSTPSEHQNNGESLLYYPSLNMVTDSTKPSNLPNLRRLFVEARTDAEESEYSRNAVGPLCLIALHKC